MFKRKHSSGYSKRQQKRRVEELTQSQRGALDKFIIKEPQGLVENLENVGHDEQANENVENLGHAHVENDNVINEEEQPSQSIPLDIYDPRTWDGLDSKSRDELLANGPRRDLSIEKGPSDKFSRHFSSTFYTRYLSNGDKYDREWLVYSKHLDKLKMQGGQF
ncbi:zinc finger MYM-type protein 5-like [Prunus avium]|uniref:Zinc finger MYM-type protein 5-like n=1 Tax=Prunus avium TaxID=42229 RepID=A0A6P5THC7_PRUAV|nr:zinc finger MYM-type protein 5-like [Prunus avium]